MVDGATSGFVPPRMTLAIAGHSKARGVVVAAAMDSLAAVADGAKAVTTVETAVETVAVATAHHLMRCGAQIVCHESVEIGAWLSKAMSDRPGRAGRARDLTCHPAAGLYAS